MNLNELKKIKGNRDPKKRVGRGYGSGKGGHTTGRGTKGQKARSGFRIPFGFEGGQVPLYLKIPSWGGFKNHNKKKVETISLTDLNSFDEGTEVTIELLREKGFITTKKVNSVKVLSNGKIEKKLVLSGLTYSEAARKKLEKASCTIK